MLFIILFFSNFSIAITSLEEDRANLSAFRMFVRFERVWFCLFSLPNGIWEGPWLVIVTLPRLVSYPFLYTVCYDMFTLRLGFIDRLCSVIKAFLWFDL